MSLGQHTADMSATGWRFHGESVYLPSTADIPDMFKPGKGHANLVRRALAAAPPIVDSGSRAIRSVELNDVKLPPLTIAVGTNYPRTWAVHRDHKARRPGLSPFVSLPARELPRQRTSTLTFEVVREKDVLLLVRAYPGDYVPPIPTMSSAEKAPGGEPACIEYWRSYAYLMAEFLNQIISGTESQSPPPWFRAEP